MNNYNKSVIGKYYKRMDAEERGESLVFEIKGFNGKYYLSNSYEIRPGTGVKEVNRQLQPEFYLNSNFREITKDEFWIIKFLYEHGGKFEYKN